MKTLCTHYLPDRDSSRIATPSGKVKKSEIDEIKSKMLPDLDNLYGLITRRLESGRVAIGIGDSVGSKFIVITPESASFFAKELLRKCKAEIAV